MRSFATLLFFLFLAVGFAFIGVDSSEARANQVNAVAPHQDELAEKIDALTKRVTELERDKANLALKNKTQAALLSEIYGWMRSVATACDNLDSSLESAKTNGFEKAGPNPKAKKDVINGLKGFAKALRVTNPAVAKKKNTK